MKLGINAVQYTQRNSGIGQYIKSICREIIPIILENNKKIDEIIIFQSEDSPDIMETDYDKVRIFKLPFKVRSINRALYEQFLLARIIKDTGINIYFSPDTRIPLGLSKNVSIISVLHDLAIYRYPEAYKKSRIIYGKWTKQYALKKSEEIITISEFTRNEAMAILNIPKGKMKVIYNGIDERFRKIDDKNELERIRKKYRLPEKFLIFVGSFSPRKNLGIMQKSLIHLKEKYPDLKLVIVGERGWKDENDIMIAKKYGIEDMVLFPGYIPDDELPIVYNLAELTVYPSLYEGFGLPPIESMACGTPCIASNNSSIPEVTQGAAILVSPNEIDLSAEIGNYLEKEYKEKEKIINDGLEVSKKYNWRSTALSISEIIAKY